ncbi:UNVERIFIED_CONTAM: protein CLT2, chloroplastic [Sesamum angustifolium]|uniref:Protein CLT2, chloroplastic n=1 Tax=Sesamum angustifolium TaxID=2727405 RepID=A0AAW2KNN1_9LAMI
MELLTPKSSAPSFVSTYVHGSKNGASRIGLIPAGLRLRLQPLRLSVSNVKISACKNDFECRKSIIPRFQHLVPSALAKSSSDAGPPSSNPSADKRLAVVTWAAITLVIAVGNRVLQKLALVPMKDHPFFLAQFNSFTYVVVYFSMLHLRYRAGLTTDEMLAVPKAPFIVIGLLESISMVSGIYASRASYTLIIPNILGVAADIFQNPLAENLHTEPNLRMLSCGSRCCSGGHKSCLANTLFPAGSGSANTRMLSGVGLLWPALMVASSAFQAVASIVKESVFIDAAARLKGKSLDVFVVNSFGSGFQALFVLLFLPILSNLKGIPLSELPSIFKSGAACFLNIGTNTTGCDGAPLLPLLYIISNLLFNISILNLLKVSDAIVASLAARSAGCDGAPLLPILYIISNLLFKISNLNLLKVSNAIVASLAVSPNCNLSSFPSTAIPPQRCKLEPIFPPGLCDSCAGPHPIQLSLALGAGMLMICDTHMPLRCMWISCNWRSHNLAHFKCISRGGCTTENMSCGGLVAGVPLELGLLLYIYTKSQRNVVYLS